MTRRPLDKLDRRLAVALTVVRLPVAPTTALPAPGRMRAPCYASFVVSAGSSLTASPGCWHALPLGVSAVLTLHWGFNIIDPSRRTPPFRKPPGPGTAP
jgi:hypothetical protein